MPCIYGFDAGSGSGIAGGGIRHEWALYRWASSVIVWLKRTRYPGMSTERLGWQTLGRLASRYGFWAPLDCIKGAGDASVKYKCSNLVLDRVNLR
jgi:hypothetical protein